MLHQAPLSGGEGNRTPDTQIMILLLYQLSYAARTVIVAGGSPLSTSRALGGYPRDRARTGDLPRFIVYISYIYLFP